MQDFQYSLQVQAPDSFHSFILVAWVRSLRGVPEDVIGRGMYVPSRGWGVIGVGYRRDPLPLFFFIGTALYFKQTSNFY